MKCPNCGAEIENVKVCQFCGTHITAEMQREQERINKAGCPKCGSSNIEFKRENQGEIRGKKTRTIVHQTIGFCKDCGYTWYPQEEKHTGLWTKQMWIWVLGWICIFPVPLTVLMLRKKNMKSSIKYGIIVASWVVYFLIGLSGKAGKPINNGSITGEESTVSSRDTNQVVTEASTDDISTEETSQDVEKYIYDIVEEYNSQADEKLIFVENFTPSDKNSSHYRTEFRLQTYKSAVGMSYMLSDATVDLIAMNTYLGEVSSRLYAVNVSLEQILDIMQYMSPIMDDTLSAEELSGAVRYVQANKTANGYYFGKLGITLSGSDDTGYNFMLKKD